MEKRVERAWDAICRTRIKIRSCKRAYNACWCFNCTSASKGEVEQTMALSFASLFALFHLTYTNLVESNGVYKVIAFRKTRINRKRNAFAIHVTNFRNTLQQRARRFIRFDIVRLISVFDLRGTFVPGISFVEIGRRHRRRRFQRNRQTCSSSFYVNRRKAINA